MANILIIEDEKAISNMIAMNLKLVKYRPIIAYNAEEARQAINTYDIDLALVDVMLPGEDGFALAPFILEKNIPIIFLTAKTNLVDRVHGLNLGAEDYILKPFEPAELLARIDVALRHYIKNNTYKDEYISIDFDAREVTCRGDVIELTSTEFELLAILVRNKSVALNRESLLKTVWGYDYVGETRTVDVHMQRLRKKLGVDLIQTVYKYGYKYTGGEN
ncbi:MAG: response regulator transcription factor [Christensenellaceae bacterium]|nr:response regulator transcription factor [Christensenellaceae bacterium]